MRRFLTFMICFTLAAMAWDGRLRPDSATAADGMQIATALPNHLQLAISVVWEGESMHDHNIEALREFRRQFTDVSLIHFVSPAYFLGDNGEVQLEKFRSVLQRQDRVGLLASGWRSVVTTAGVEWRQQPTFWGNDIAPSDCTGDCANDVPLTAYSAEEQRKILTHSREILEDKGLGQPQAIMVSGWIGSEATYSAMSQSGFRYDFSPVPPELLEKRLKLFPLFSWLRESWYGITPTSQPYVVSTKPEAITAIPQNLAALDYVSPQQVEQIFAEYQKVMHADRNSDQVMQLVIYQETAGNTLPRLKTSLRHIFSEATQNGINLKHLNLPETGVRDKYALEPIRYAPPRRFVH